VRYCYEHFQRWIAHHYPISDGDLPSLMLTSYQSAICTVHLMENDWKRDVG
jgi:hypothetical protein